MNECGQAISPLISAFQRVSQLLQSGVQPSKAFKQVADELQTYAEEHHRQSIPTRPFTLGDSKKAA